LTGEADRSDKILQKLDDKPLQREIQPGVMVNLEAPEDYDSEVVKAKVLANVQSAVQKQQNKVREVTESVTRLCDRDIAEAPSLHAPPQQDTIEPFCGSPSLPLFLSGTVSIICLASIF
jgi:hypothetical protein